MRDIVVFSGSSNEALTQRICRHLGLPLGRVELKKFANGETSVQFNDSVREKDVFIIQSAGSGNVNDNFIQLLIMISACKMASSKRITVVCPFFFYSRQVESPASKKGVPSLLSNNKNLTFDSVPPSPRPLSRNGLPLDTKSPPPPLSTPGFSALSPPLSASASIGGIVAPSPLNPLISRLQSTSLQQQQQPKAFNENSSSNTSSNGSYYKSWIAQSGTLIANLLVASGANHIITMDLHESHYQGFFDIPVDNLYSKSLLQHYIVNYIPNYKNCVIVSPDAGGAKRATAIADSLGLPCALIHKERRLKVSNGSHHEHPVGTATPCSDDLMITNSSAINSVTLGMSSSNASLNTLNSNVGNGDKIVATTMLVGNVQDKVCVIVDDLIDTANTVVRASKLLKDQGAKFVYVLTTHGIFSGDALKKIKSCNTIDRIVSTNTVDQEDHHSDFTSLGGSFETLDVSKLFAEAIRRINNGESVSIIYDQGW